jgi:hypothetical protein
MVIDASVATNGFLMNRMPNSQLNEDEARNRLTEIESLPIHFTPVDGARRLSWPSS